MEEEWPTRVVMKMTAMMKRFIHWTMSNMKALLVKSATM
jgi:hypothetical protein